MRPKCLKKTLNLPLNKNILIDLFVLWEIHALIWRFFLQNLQNQITMLTKDNTYFYWIDRDQWWEVEFNQPSNLWFFSWNLFPKILFTTLFPLEANSKECTKLVSLTTMKTLNKRLKKFKIFRLTLVALKSLPLYSTLSKSKSKWKITFDMWY